MINTCESGAGLISCQERLRHIDFMKRGNMWCRRTDAADDGVVTHGPIIEAEGGVRTDPFSLPEGFRWDNLELRSQTAVSFCL